VLDMKGGLALFIYGLKALLALDVPIERKVALWVVSDEEVGSLGSRARTEALAREGPRGAGSGAVHGPRGKPEDGAQGRRPVPVGGARARRALGGGLSERARARLSNWRGRFGVLAGFSDDKKGITVNPGVISGGTRSNVVAAEARR